jgi:hypothetical protein
MEEMIVARRDRTRRGSMALMTMVAARSIAAPRMVADRVSTETIETGPRSVDIATRTIVDMTSIDIVTKAISGEMTAETSGVMIIAGTTDVTTDVTTVVTTVVMTDAMIGTTTGAMIDVTTDVMIDATIDVTTDGSIVVMIGQANVGVMQKPNLRTSGKRRRSSGSTSCDASVTITILEMETTML